MPYEKTPPIVAYNPSLKIWDTQYCSASESFSLFREGVCANFMPWTPERNADRMFEARIEGVKFREGSAAHVTMTPLVATRTRANVADSPLHGIYANLVLSGEMCVEQAGRTTLAKRGDLVVYDTSLPVTMTGRGKGNYEDISFLFCGSSFATSPNGAKEFRNVVVTRSRMIQPFAKCLDYLVQNVATGAHEELAAVFSACTSLLPVAVDFVDRGEIGESAQSPGGHLLREIMEFINHNIQDADLCPSRAAEHFGISSRYVHKLFAASSTTFSAYVVAKRLEHIQRDLLCPSCCKQPISSLAYRWGFNDLSSFNRTFKQRFGCSPSHFRAQSGR